MLFSFFSFICDGGLAGGLLRGYGVGFTLCLWALRESRTTQRPLVETGEMVGSGGIEGVVGARWCENPPGGKSRAGS
jgi:hypothetical protein